MWTFVYMKQKMYIFWVNSTISLYVTVLRQILDYEFCFLIFFIFSLKLSCSFYSFHFFHSLFLITRKMQKNMQLWLLKMTKYVFRNRLNDLTLLYNNPIIANIRLFSISTLANIFVLFHFHSLVLFRRSSTVNTILAVNMSIQTLSVTYGVDIKYSSYCIVGVHFLLGFPVSCQKDAGRWFGKFTFCL